VREVVDGSGDEVDGYDIDPAPFDSEHWHPRRQRGTQFLDELEEIVRAIDLVDVPVLESPTTNPGR